MIELEPIPPGVYYDAEFENFLSADGGGMGYHFFGVWASRHAEFPAWVPYNRRPAGTCNPARLPLSQAYSDLHAVACKVRDALQLHQNTRLSATLAAELDGALKQTPYFENLELAYEGERDRLLEELDRVTGTAGLLRNDLDTLVVRVEDLLDLIPEPPAKNCSCHVSPPCHDCVDYSGEREARANVQDALKACRDTLKPATEIKP